ncbi:TonB-dependent receptor [Asticcacaulis sp. SL142]|uniref:TonB-dependent receptor domain-containing protein n=1 Tax=Asticcacaulis sp. SL142 TaxID=2995155 RepID=UPI00226CA40F|nr:TonB-dependent receptor [Asticcacaulis sp. SL142]WAC46851.1 TonB-dependent receptor [Asticcacaulis sp. SL142]
MKSLKVMLCAGVSSLAVAMVAVPVYAQNAAPAVESADEADTVVVVTARRKALQSAIEIKKNSDTIVDSVVADEAGQLPDASITEVLQRVSGVTVSRFAFSQGGTPSFQVEGTGVTVRGLPYNSSTLNGRQAFSANGASGLMWDEVTPELMAGVDIYKASRADILEGGASAIDLRTRLPFDYKKPALELSAGASYGDLSDKVSPNISGLVSRRFDTKLGEMGLLFDIAHSERYEGNDNAQMGAYALQINPERPENDNTALVPTGYNWNQGRSERTRDGVYVAYQWEPKDELTLTSTLFYSQKKSKTYGRGGGWSVDPTLSAQNIPTNATYDSNGAMVSGDLYVGATGIGDPVFGWGGNNWLLEYLPRSDPAYEYIWAFDWSPDYQGTPGDTILDQDCRSTYGSTSTSQPSIDWGKWGQPGMFFCQPTGGSTGTPLNLTGSASASDSTSSTLDWSTSFVWNPTDNMRVRGALQFVHSVAEGRNMGAGITQRSEGLTQASFDVTGDVPKLGGFNAAALVDTDTAHFAQFSYNGADNEGTAIAANIDVDYSLNEDNFFKSVSWGVRAAVREERDNFIGTYWAPISKDWVDYTYPSGQNPDNIGYRAYLTGDYAIGVISPSDYEVYDFPNFMGDDTNSPGAVLVPSESLLKSFDWTRLASFSEDVVNGGLTPQEYYDLNIDQNLGVTNTDIRSTAIYVQTKFGSEGFGIIPRFTGNMGVRVVNGRLRGDGNFRVNQADAFYLNVSDASSALSGIPQGRLYQPIPGSTLREKEIRYIRVLPSVNVKFDVSSEVVVRFAASQGVSQPNLNDIRAGGTIEPNLKALIGQGGASINYLETMTSRGGGADMKPVSFTNLDLTYEWYPRNGTYAYIDVFAKDIKNQDLYDAFYQTQSTPLLDVTDPNNPVEVSVDIPWFYVQNRTTSASEKAKIRGVEIGGRTFLDMLPSPFDGLGISANFTYVDSENPALLANSVKGDGYVPDGLDDPRCNTVSNGDPCLDPSYNPDFGTMPYYGMSKYSYNVELYYSKGAFNTRLAYNWRSKQLMGTSANPLSYVGRGGGPRICTACTDSSSQGRIWDMVPMWSDDAGFLDWSLDYKLNNNVSFGVQANNLTNTKSKTLQEPLPGVFLRYDTYVSDRRVNAYLRMRY